MLPDSFAGAWIHEDHAVLGRKLLPYCLWHRFALEAMESPFLADNGSPQLDALDIAVRICRSRYPERGQNFQRTINLPRAGRLNRLRVAYIARRYDPIEEGSKFVAYVRDFGSMPQFWQTKGNASAQTSGAPPDVLSVISRLMLGGKAEAEAWMMPIGRAYWLSATLAQQAGCDVRFRSETEKLLAGLRKLQAAMKAGLINFPKEASRYAHAGN